MTNRGLKTTAVIMAVVIVLLLCFSVFSFSQSRKSAIAVTSGYNRAFYELFENTEKIYYALSKASLASDSYQLMKLSSQIKESAAFAISDIGQLPVNSLALENINTFLNQAGDYTYTVAVRHLSGSVLTGEERQTFLTLAAHAEKLKDSLYKIRDSVASGEISFEKASREELSSFSQSFYDVEETGFSDYQHLTYDGPFSEHMNTLGSVMLESLSEISESEAFSVAMKVLSGNVGLTLLGETAGVIPSYMFQGDTENCHYNVEISKKGGKCLSITCDRPVGDPRYDISEALLAAKGYLKDIGYENTVETYYESSGSIVTINFASYEHGIIAYPDLIKVQVALDNLEILGLEAEGYLMNYHSRAIPEVLISNEEIEKKILEGFAVDTISLAIIPTEYGGEHLCYELSGRLSDKTYLIYINAISGTEEEILLLTEDEYSRLAK